MKFLIILLFIFPSSNIYAAVCSTDVCQIANGATDDISRHGLCTKVTNTSGKALFVGTQTYNQLNSFINAAAISGITKGTCNPITTPLTMTTVTGIYAVNCTVSKPTGLQVGDLMLTHLYTRSNSGAPTVNAPAGWTIIGSMAGPSCTNYYFVNHYKIADAADVAASNFTFTRTTHEDCAIMLGVFRNVNATTPVADRTRNTGTGTTITYPSATATAVDSLSYVIGESCVSDGPGQPTGYSTVIALPSTYTRFSKKTLTATGATGTTTGSVPSGAWIGTNIIINPL